MNKIILVGQPEVTSKVGGAISVFVCMCNLFAKNGYDTCGLCYSETDGMPKGMSSGTRFVNLYNHYNDTKGYTDAFQRFVRTENPDLIIFSFHYLYINAQLGREFDRIPRILMFQSRPDYYFEYVRHSEKHLKRIYRNAVSHVLMDSFKSLLPDFIKKGRIVTIPNYVKETDLTVDYSSQKNRCVFYSRIDRWKGVDLLIDSFGLLASDFPEWSVDIYGEAESEQFLEGLKERAEKNGIKDRVNFMGVTSNPYETLVNYDFCVFPSVFEGFSLGLVESMAVGLPCVGRLSCSGVNEMIIDGVNGLLCGDDARDFANGMRLLMSDVQNRARMGKNAKIYVSQFSISLFEQRWLGLAEELIHHKPVPTDYLADVKKIVRM
ncbi:MAG: glycosyltransferase [Bacteroidaceae bacterium]|nr:glycosyltransferase [Bacteroidaceae bacterium]